MALMVTDTEFALEPIRLFAGDRLLSAKHGDQSPSGMELIADLARAMPVWHRERGICVLDPSVLGGFRPVWETRGSVDR
ncbi:hypothetical protein LA66_15895 [Aureimonas altamirensis]|uniref:Uncharacterized protein n=1 Tax=Aureimonas altamirensis TaxID=370622 RepID=A0A0B1Q563_9HYPH|nr:hypothetical protein LA66_15895 [Aureimonas altamirensis]